MPSPWDALATTLVQGVTPGGDARPASRCWPCHCPAWPVHQRTASLAQPAACNYSWVACRGQGAQEVTGGTPGRPHRLGWCHPRHRLRGRCCRSGQLCEVVYELREDLRMNALPALVGQESFGLTRTFVAVPDVGRSGGCGWENELALVLEPTDGSTSDGRSADGRPDLWSGPPPNTAVACWSKDRPKSTGQNTKHFVHLLMPYPAVPR